MLFTILFQLAVESYYIDIDYEKKLGEQVTTIYQKSLRQAPIV